MIALAVFALAMTLLACSYQDDAHDRRVRTLVIDAIGNGQRAAASIRDTLAGNAPSARSVKVKLIEKPDFRRSRIRGLYETPLKHTCYRDPLPRSSGWRRRDVVVGYANRP